MLRERVFSALIGIPVFLFFLYQGGYLFLFGILVLASIMLWELQIILQKMNFQLNPLLFWGGGLSYPLLAYFALKGEAGELLWVASIVVLLLHFIGFLSSSRISLGSFAASFLGNYYIGGLLCFLVLIRKDPLLGFKGALLVTLMTWAYDTGAFFAGKYLGSHLLLPEISPKKTVEGVIGGLFLSSLVASVVAHLFFASGLFNLIGLGIIVGVFVQIGDLVESALKRKAGLKDSGKLLPGHGGILDRFDGFLWSCPIFYFYFQIFGI